MAVSMPGHVTGPGVFTDLYNKPGYKTICVTNTESMEPQGKEEDKIIRRPTRPIVKMQSISV